MKVRSTAQAAKVRAGLWSAARWGLCCAAFWSAACSEDAPSGGAAGDENNAQNSGGCPEGSVEVEGECRFPNQLVLGPAQIGPARQGLPFSAQFEATGGAPPYVFSVVDGLPGWLTLTEQGLLSGTPLETGEETFTLRATDASGDAGELALTLRIVKEDCPADEVCGNSQDDNCDGQIDEDCEECVPSEEVCQNLADDDCDGEVDEGCELCEPSVELCDGVDNDCNEQIDEGCPVCEPSDEACDGVDNDCDGDVDEGVLNACGVCGPTPEEVCDDGLDDDCDGVADDGCVPGCVPAGEEACDNGLDDDCDGEVDEGCEACVPAEEVCDFVDNDCDGLTDEEVLNACGTCGAPPEETCDGTDDDCDGEVDEGCPCVGEVEEACGSEEGACAAGTRRCVEGAWGACEGALAAQPEVCDGVDNDCDGLTDEGTLNACGACGPVPAELCDGVDNDCDGQADEGVLNACGVCGVEPFEECDGVDNDCDGLSDEGCECLDGEQRPCGSEVGACELGVQVCDGGVFGACEGLVGPSDEACDGVDNDCDGSTDELLADLGACASENDFGSCEGALRCVDGALACDAPAPSAEVCDGADNDCDGSTDEDDAGLALTRLCTAQGCASDGAQTCEGGAWGACAFPEESCDGVDNDCDGLSDESFVGQGEPCGAGPGVCMPGRQVCEGGAVLCEGILLAQPEVCDGADNDCDGSTDEGLLNACGACGAVPAEVCDGVDNDCDGSTDEEDPSLGLGCVTSRCGYGALACQGGALACALPLEQAITPGSVETVPVETGFIRSYTGTDEPFSFFGQTSYTVLLASDGERLYNVGFGIDGEPFQGWTVKVFEAGTGGLSLVERFEVETDWDDFDADELGFVGVAADGERLWVTNVADPGEDGSIWSIDLTERSAQVERFWDGRNTYEGGATWDRLRDRFWTLQFNLQDPTVFRYPGSGIDPQFEESRFVLDVPTGDNRLGAITSDGQWLYAMVYDSSQGAQGAQVWSFGSGFGGTLPGAGARPFAQVRGAASVVYHGDGYLYVPLQNNLGQVQRVAATAGAQPDACDGLDNDCNGVVDDGAVCVEGVDLDAFSVLAAQSVGQRRVQVTYSAINRGAGLAGARRDVVRLIDPNSGVTVAELASLDRPALPGYQSDRVFVVLDLPADLATGQWQVAVVADVDNLVGDVDRSNNTGRALFNYVIPPVCPLDRFEANESRDSARSVERTGIYRELTLCEGDQDWYYVDLPARGRGRAVLAFSSAQGNLDLYAYDRNGALVSQSTGAGDFERVDFRNDNGDNTRRFYIQVVRSGQSGQVNYVLTMVGL